MAIERNQTRRAINRSASAWQGYECFLESLPIRQGKLATCRRVQNLCICCSVVLLGHAAQCIEGQRCAVDGGEFVFRVVDVVVADIAEKVAVVVKSGYGQEPVLSAVETWLERNAAALGNVAEGIGSESLAPCCPAVYARDSREVVVTVAAGLSVGAVERIGDGQRL